jgi:anti-sigma-K factor RskA
MTDELPETEALAAEYVLGSLDRGARVRAEQMRQSDPAFARLVDLWQQRLAPLAAAAPAVRPPPKVWAAIEQALAGQRRAPVPRSVPRRRPGRLGGEQGERLRLAHSLAFWRRWALGASALAAALALYIVLMPAAPPATRYVALLGAGDATPALLVTVDPAAGRKTIQPLETAAVEDRALQLWLVAGGQAPPRSLGLLDPVHEIALKLDPQAEARLRPSAALAVSLEPPGGSPTGLPTGPVIYQGPLLALAE